MSAYQEAQGGVGHEGEFPIAGATRIVRKAQVPKRVPCSSHEPGVKLEGANVLVYEGLVGSPSCRFARIERCVL